MDKQSEYRFNLFVYMELLSEEYLLSKKILYLCE